MYAYLEGKLAGLNPAIAVVDCNGVAYELQISLHTYSKIKDSEHCKLLTHLVVREDAQILFGFADEEERKMFRHLISVSGVGANTARMILSSLGPDEVFSAIRGNDITRLQSIKGIGTKSAQRIVVDLSDKIKKEGIMSDILPDPNNRNREEALSALSMLGFNKAASTKVVDKVLQDEGFGISVEELVKKALQRL